MNGGVKNLEKGNSEIVAEFIKNAVGGDLFEIETVKAYPDVAKRELKEQLRPELKKYLDDISGYENIFICGPCWRELTRWRYFPSLKNLITTAKIYFPF